MFIIDFRNKLVSNNNFSVIGNNNVDVVYFYSHFTQYASGYNVYLKVISEDERYIDKILIDSENISIEGDALLVKWTMGEVSTQCKKIDVQLQFENNDGSIIAQTRIVSITLGDTIDADTLIPIIYPKILTQLQEQITNLKSDSVASFDMSFANDTLIINLKNKDGNIVATDQITIALSNKVDKVEGKGLSTNDFTNALKSKLDTILLTNQADKVYGTNGNGEQTAHSVSTTANADTIVKRDNGGRIATATPINQTDATNKDYVDSIVASIKRDSYKQVDITQYPTLNDFLASTGEEGFLYLYPIDTTEAPTFNSGFYRYVWENNAWLYLGTTQIDLSNYYTKPQVDEKLSHKPSVYEVEDVANIPTNILEQLKVGDIIVYDKTGDGYEYKYQPYVVHDVTIEGEQKYIYLHWFEADGYTIHILSYSFENGEWSCDDYQEMKVGNVSSINGQGADGNGNVDLPCAMVYYANNHISNIPSYILEEAKIGDIIIYDNTQMAIVWDIDSNNDVRTGIYLLNNTYDESLFYLYSYTKANNRWQYNGESTHSMGAISVNGYGHDSGDGNIELPCSMKIDEFSDYDELYNESYFADHNIGDFFVRTGDISMVKKYTYTSFEYVQQPNEMFFYTLETDNEIVRITHDTSNEEWSHEVTSKTKSYNIDNYGGFDNLPSKFVDKLECGDTLSFDGLTAFVTSMDRVAHFCNISTFNSSGVITWRYEYSNNSWNFVEERYFGFGNAPRVYEVSGIELYQVCERSWFGSLRKGDVIIGATDVPCALVYEAETTEKIIIAYSYSTTYYYDFLKNSDNQWYCDNELGKPNTGLRKKVITIEASDDGYGNSVSFKIYVVQSNDNPLAKTSTFSLKSMVEDGLSSIYMIENDVVCQVIDLENTQQSGGILVIQFMDRTGQVHDYGIDHSNITKWNVSYNPLVD